MSDNNNNLDNNELFPAENQPVVSAPVPPVEAPVCSTGEKETEDDYSVRYVRKAVGCGIFLRERRQEMNLTLEDVSAETMIKTELLEALEEENFSALPQPVYVAAYVKRLCRFYKVDEDTAENFLSCLREEISFEVPEDVSRNIKGSDVSEENMRRVRNLALATIFVFLLLLLLIGFGVTMVVVYLQQSDHRLTQPAPLTEKVLVDLQDKPKLRLTEL